jgi:hypothetical protein
MLLKKKVTGLLFVLFSIFFSVQVIAEENIMQASRLEKALSPLGNNIVGKPLPEIIINEPYRYISGRPGKYIYQMIVKDDYNPGTKFEIRSEIEGALDESRKWSLKVDNDFIEEWKADAEGNVHLQAQTDLDSGYRVEISPHLLLPAGAQPGQRWEIESSLNVYEISSPEAIAYEGKLLSKKVYEGHFEVMTPAGEFDAILISDVYEISIGAVNIKDRRYTFYAPNVGKVAEIDGFHVSAFLFFHQRRNDAKVLIALPPTTEE